VKQTLHVASAFAAAIRFDFGTGPWNFPTIHTGNSLRCNGHTLDASTNANFALCLIASRQGWISMSIAPSLFPVPSGNLINSPYRPLKPSRVECLAELAERCLKIIIHLTTLAPSVAQGVLPGNQLVDPIGDLITAVAEATQFLDAAPAYRAHHDTPITFGEIAVAASRCEVALDLAGFVVHQAIEAAGGTNPGDLTPGTVRKFAECICSANIPDVRPLLAQLRQEAAKVVRSIMISSDKQQLMLEAIGAKPRLYASNPQHFPATP
jgi:hypothetical protein